jgi:hypothetical protein
MRGIIAHLYAFVIAAVALAVGASSCSRSWELPGSAVDASGSGGPGNGGAATGGTTGTAGAPGSGGFGPFGGTTGAAGTWGRGAFGGMTGPAGASGRGGPFGGMTGAAGRGGLGAFGGTAFPFGTGGGSGCFPTEKHFDNHTANVMFVVGRDSDMSTKFGDSSRMNAVRDTLLQTVSDNQRIVGFGYQDFPMLAGCSGQTQCCSPNSFSFPYQWTSSNPSQAPLLKFMTEFGPCAGVGPGDSCFATTTDARPAFAALSNVRGNLLSQPPLFVVLLLDGPPSCPSETAAKSCTDAQGELSKLTNTLGAVVSVIAIGQDAIDDPCLKGMSAQPAADPKALSQVLTNIASEAASNWCTLEFDERPSDDLQIWVSGDRMIRRDPIDGWAFTSPTSKRIRVNGASCKMVQDAARDVTVTETVCR